MAYALIKYGCICLLFEVVGLTCLITPSPVIRFCEATIIRLLLHLHGLHFFGLLCFPSLITELVSMCGKWNEASVVIFMC